MTKPVLVMDNGRVMIQKGESLLGWTFQSMLGVQKLRPVDFLDLLKIFALGN